MHVANSIVVVLHYFLSMISTNFNIIVDRMIGAPEHGQDVVGGNILSRKCVLLVDQRLMTKNQE